MASPASTTANIQIALNQILEGVSTSPGRPAVTAMGYTIISEWPINGVLRSLYVIGGPKGAGGGTSTNFGAPGGACWFDCSMTASATQKAADIIYKLSGGTGPQGPFG